MSQIISRIAGAGLAGAVLASVLWVIVFTQVVPWPGHDRAAYAQESSLQPQNIRVTNGPNAGEVEVVWDAVEGAAYYRITWTQVDEYKATVDAGRPWTDAFYFADVRNPATARTVKGLVPETDYWFFVGGQAVYNGAPVWGTAKPFPITIRAVGVPVGDYDADNNGLIEIATLDQLDVIRYDGDGDGNVADQHYVMYTQAFVDAAHDMGCPPGGCFGYELVADLDFDTNRNGEADAGDAYWNDGKGWFPIKNPDQPFAATLVGNDATIHNLYVNRPDENYVGLFGIADFGSTIRGVALASVNVTGRTYVAGLVGNSRGASISGSSVSGSVSGSGAQVGGLVGRNASTSAITDSHSAAAVTGKTEVGGLVGKNSSSTIYRAYATGPVAGQERQIGGLVGDNSGGMVLFGYATGTVTGGAPEVGGLIGINYGGIIRGAYATGAITGSSDDVGGLVGENWGGNIRDAYATGTVTGTGPGSDEIGGLVGDNRGTLFNGYASGNVSGSGGADEIGGLVGHNQTRGAIYYSYARGHVSAPSGAQDAKPGGLIAVSEGYVTASYWDTQTSGQASSAAGEGKTTSELQTPTSNTGIYERWNPNTWDFGTVSQYPVLTDGLDPAAQR